MKTLTGISLMLVAGGLLLTGCGGEAEHEGHDHGAVAPAGGAAIAQKTCPVMEGRRIDPKLFADDEGRRIYFCCRACIGMFEKDPEKYVKKVDAELAGAKAGGSAKQGHEGHNH
ncbi:MAG: hypothetical protein ACYTGB_04770 [Planctomycetota bacterium]|jgi:YHS domain-containing protein